MPALGLALSLPYVRNASGFAGVLDDYTASLWGAYSVSRKLLTDYNGALIRVRRSSDSTEQDINALANGELDVDSLLSFCGAGNGFVTKVYDQLDLADMVQATAGAQPQIVASGALCVNNLGLPAMQGASKRLTATFASTMTLPVAVYANAAPSTAAAFELLWGIADSSRWFGKTSAQRMYAENGRMTTFTIKGDAPRRLAMSMPIAQFAKFPWNSLGTSEDDENILAWRCSISKAALSRAICTSVSVVVISLLMVMMVWFRLRRKGRG